MRDANRKFIDETKALEATNPEEAICRYRQAIEAMREYASIQYETGLISELLPPPSWDDPVAIDRLTLCLNKLGKYKDSADSANAYFATYPVSRNTALGDRVMKRINKGLQKLEK